MGVNIELLVEDCLNEEILEKILEETASIPPSIETTGYHWVQTAEVEILNNFT